MRRLGDDAKQPSRASRAFVLLLMFAVTGPVVFSVLSLPIRVVDALLASAGLKAGLLIWVPLLSMAAYGTFHLHRMMWARFVEPKLAGDPQGADR